MACELLALYERLGLPSLLENYFGEPARLSVKKWVLRKMAPKKNGNAGWHQDGRFLGEHIRSVNLWLALSDCGGGAPAPGMDLLVDGRREIHPTGTDGAWFDWTVGPERVARLATEAPISQPRFAPGDALLFDHFSLHRTALEDHHNALRYAIEAWFFAASTAPARQQPLYI
jgi:ectoine hydroxylase-related dioxygenase (phytanoyl-CoA dioxygenase family)